MKIVLKIVAGAFGALLLVIALTLIGARFADGPLAIIAGGPFTSGELYSGPEPDWSFAKEIGEVEFQLLEPARSRTTWIIEHEGRVYIPSGYMTTTWGKLWKQWPIEALKDGRVILRVDGTLYERNLVRVASGRELPALTAELGRKYLGGADPGPEAVTSGYLWIFELAPEKLIALALSNVPTFVRYIGFQLPSWMLVVGIAIALDTWTELSRLLLAGAVLAFMMKDFAIYPFVRTAYEHAEHDPASTLRGARAVVVVALDPKGWVQVGSERWRAELTGGAEATLPPGAAVEVRAVSGHTLIVDAVQDDA